MATKTTARRRGQPKRQPRTSTARPQTPPTTVPDQAAAPAAENTVPLVFEEADPVLADAADRAADLRDQAAADAARIVAAGEARAAELLDGARTEAVTLTEEATAEQSRLLAEAATAADQARTDAETTAEQLLADAREQAEALTTEATGKADELLADAAKAGDRIREDAASSAAADAQRVRTDAEATAQQLLADARGNAEALTTAAAGKAEEVLAGARRQAQDALTDAAADAERVRTEAGREAAQVLVDATDKHAELLAEAERTAADTRTGAAKDAEQVLERARADAERTRESADEQAAQVRAGAEKLAAGLRADADRALDDARASAEELRTAVDKDVARLREQAETDQATARDAAAKATADQAAAAQALAEAERILEAATQRTVQRARRREIRAESRAARRKARHDARPAGGVPPLSGQELLLVVGIVLAAAVVSTLGLLSSYTALEAKAAAWGWEWPWLLPVGIDVAIPAFTGANLILIRMGMELRWIRWVPRALTAVTVYLNWNASDSASGRIGHAALTLLWVVFSEIASHVYATRIGAVTGKVRMETVRRSRWILAPIPTARLRRRMILWEITSYEEALTRLQEQTYLRAQLKEKYGWRWRSKAPLDMRMALKLDTAPAALADTLTPEDAHTIERLEESADAHPEQGDAHPEMSALTSGNGEGERERPALTAGAHDGERPVGDDDAHRAESARTRSEQGALTERRHERIRLLYTALGRRPEWTEIRDALTEAGLSDEPVSRPTAQRLRAQVEEGTPSAPASAEASVPVNA
ncbi:MULTISPECIES: DUF2637 domain-containing protein [unclassified Streptomyces]|uniref:DUF2637 domain-containing protein n=1 Tax=unclassified Streptomyces TaxID=2593676 RepID=UPI002E2CD5DA|nr:MULTISPECIES: DUF2637 domain-containing protein [unclassified Streptomyces]